MKAIVVVIPHLCMLLLAIPLSLSAQKLPPVQKDNLRAPTDIKIDGKLSEWGNKFQAYNSATSIFYSMANDGENLYLAVQATDPLVVRKILNGGITIQVNSGASVTYPVFTTQSRPVIDLRNKPAASDKKLLDSFVYVINKRFADKSKDIKVQGIPAITDSVISIYNEQGIKAAVLFDDDAKYNYELAIPLKYLNITNNTNEKFKYTITLSGKPMLDGVTVTPGAVPGGITKISVQVDMRAPRTAPLTREDIAALTSPTYFNGEYILALK